MKTSSFSVVVIARIPAPYTMLKKSWITLESSSVLEITYLPGVSNFFTN